RRSADRDVAGDRGPRRRPAPALGRGRLADGAHDRRAAHRRPHVFRRGDPDDGGGTRAHVADLRPSRVQAGLIDAVVFDLDGVMVDSEQVWDQVRHAYTEETGREYGRTAARDMQGMSSFEWSRYMAETLGVPGTPEEINAAIVERMLERYGTAPPLIPGAVDAVRRCAERWPLA